MPITLTLATVPRPGTRPGRRRALPSREGVRMVVTVVVIVVMITVSVSVRVIGVPRSGRGGLLRRDGFRLRLISEGEGVGPSMVVRHSDRSRVDRTRHARRRSAVRPCARTGSGSLV